MSKNLTEFENRSKATYAKIYVKICRVCGKEYLMAKNQKFCSVKCKGKVKYINGKAATENQYEKISGNWTRYCSRLLYYGDRKRDKLTRELILKQLEKQNYKCALSGVDLTCNLEKGIICKTNATIDRIQAGGSYTSDNIQIVCGALNGFRSNTPVEEFINWCALVAKHNNKI